MNSKSSLPQIVSTIPEDQWKKYNNLQEWRQQVESLSDETGLTPNQSSYLLSRTRLSPKIRKTDGRYPADFFEPIQIKLLAFLLGYNLNSTLETNVNFIRNKIGFPGVVNRDFFMTEEVDEILRILKISTTLPLDKQKEEIKKKLAIFQDKKQLSPSPKNKRFDSKFG